MRRNLPQWALGGYLIAYGAVQVALALKTNFRPAENDFLGIMKISQGMDAADWASLHNGFFASALPLLLTRVPDSSVLMAAGALSLAFGLITLGAIYVIGARLAGRWWGLAAVVLVSCNPLFFDYVASPGPDVIAMGLTTLGLACYAYEARRPWAPRSWVILGSGLLLGAAGLFRSYALILAICLFVWAYLQREHRRRLLGLAALGVLLGILPQVIINLGGGFGPLDAETGFYIYMRTVGMDWYATGALPRESFASVAGVITGHPRAFLQAYVLAFTNFVIPLALLAVAVAVTRVRRIRTVLISMFAGTLGFALLVSAASSPRGPLPVIPLAAVGMVVIGHWLYRRAASRGPAWQPVVVLVVVGAVVVWPYLYTIAFATAAKVSAAGQQQAVEAAVRERTSIADAREILTNDFFLYFDSIAGNVPDQIGGWGNISLNGRRIHRDVLLSSIPDFACDARSRGITTVLWKPGTVFGVEAGLAAALEGRSQSPLLVNEGMIGPYVVTVLAAGGGDCPAPTPPVMTVG